MKNFILTLLIVFLFLSFSLSQDIPTVRIGLFKLDREIFLSNVGRVINSYIQIEAGGNGKVILKSFENGSIILNFGKDVLILTLPVFFYPQQDKKIGINSSYYRGIIEINNDGWVINTLNLEDYLLGVVPSEMPYNYPLEALKAQAVSARTYALSNLGKHKDFDLCSTVHCQVYKGASYEKERSNMAVKETMGEVITYNGQLIKAFYHSSSGGITENSEDVWGGYYPYLRSVKDVEELERDTWEVFLSLDDIKRKLSNININLQEVISIELDKSSTGRVKNVIIRSNSNDWVFKGTLWRELFNLPSTLFNIEFSNNGLYLYGRGMGHGVGLSQKGAKILAEKGYNYRDIIKFYYQGVEIQKWY
ncbi:MAG: SpoIID/LytB domain-containing protein [Dictyoglomaceae bacterium]